MTPPQRLLSRAMLPIAIDCNWGDSCRTASSGPFSITNGEEWVESGPAGSGSIAAIAVIDEVKRISDPSVMSDAHSKIIAAAAKAELGPLGFRQKGRSRLWFADHGYWLNVVEFTPSRWSKSMSLTNAVHWLWVGAGFMSFNQAFSSNCHADFETEDQFSSAAIEVAKVARAKAFEIEAQFATFNAIADFVVERARSSPDRMGLSWWGFEAGIASGLIGKFDDARYFLSRLDDQRLIQRAVPLLPLIDQAAAFRSKVNDLVVQQRAILKLEPLASLPF